MAYCGTVWHTVALFCIVDYGYRTIELNTKRKVKMKENTKENTKEKIKEPFFIVPSKVFELGLNPYELSVLFYLMMRADNEMHSCFPSEKGIADACGMGKTSVTKSIKSLDEKGIIKKESKFQKSKNGLMRQTANEYIINCYSRDGSKSENSNEICSPRDMGSPRDRGDTVTQPPPTRLAIPPISPRDREINKTIPNITKSNITKSTELSLDLAVELEKERFSFCEFKRSCFETLENEKGLDREYCALLDRALEYLWFKSNAEYEGRKYNQSELRAMLNNKLTPDILLASVEFLEHSAEPVRSPVPYLAKCILGGLVHGFLEYKKPNDDGKNPFEKTIKTPDNCCKSSTFEVDDFFTQALKNTYGDNFGL